MKIELYIIESGDQDGSDIWYIYLNQDKALETFKDCVKKGKFILDNENADYAKKEHSTEWISINTFYTDDEIDLEKIKNE